MKYAAIYLTQMHQSTPGETLKHIRTFLGKEDMVKWIATEAPKYVSYELIEYEPIKVKTTVEIIKEPVYRGDSSAPQEKRFGSKPIPAISN